MMQYRQALHMILTNIYNTIVDMLAEIYRICPNNLTYPYKRSQLHSLQATVHLFVSTSL